MKLVPDTQGRTSVRLCSNENPIGPSKRVKEAIVAATERLGFYPDTDCSQAEASIAAHLGVPPTQVTLASGGFGVLTLMAAAFVRPRDEVVLADPSYPLFRYLSLRAGAAPVPVKLTSDFKHDFDAMAAAVTPRTKLVFLCNPNNPTGTVCPKEDIRRFLDQVPQEVLVMIDEAYVEYARAAGFPDCLDIARGRPNVVLLRSFSKAHGIAGLRVGFAVGACKLMATLRGVRDPFSVNTIAQAAAMAAMSDSHHVAEVTALNQRMLAVLDAAAEGLDLPYVRSVTNFVMMRCGGDDTQVVERLRANGILVRGGTEYGMRGWIRVSTSTPENTANFVGALGKVLAELNLLKAPRVASATEPVPPARRMLTVPLGVGEDIPTSRLRARMSPALVEERR